MQEKHKRNRKTRHTLMLSIAVLALGLGLALTGQAADREAQLQARETALGKLSQGEVGTADLDITLRQLRETGSLRFAWRENAQAAQDALDSGKYTDTEDKAKLSTFLGYSLGCRGQYQDAMLSLRRVPESSSQHEEALNLEIRYARKLDLLPTIKNAAIKFMTRYPDSIHWDEVYKNYIYCYRVYQLKAGQSYMFYGDESGLQVRYTRREERKEGDPPPPFSEPLSQEVIQRHHSEIGLIRTDSRNSSTLLLDYAELLLDSGQNDFQERLETFARNSELQTPKWKMRIWLAKVRDAAQRVQQDELDAALLERPVECQGSDLDRLALISLDDPTLEDRFKYQLARAFYEKASDEEMRARTLAIATVWAYSRGLRNEGYLLECYDKLVLDYPNHPWTLYARAKTYSDVRYVRREYDRKNAPKRTRLTQLRVDKIRRSQRRRESVRSLREIFDSETVELCDDRGLYQEGCSIARTTYLEKRGPMLESRADELLEASNLAIENLKTAAEIRPEHRRLKEKLKKSDPTKTPPARIPRATQAQHIAPPMYAEPSVSEVLSVSDEVMKFVEMMPYAHDVRPDGWSAPHVSYLMNGIRDAEINSPNTWALMYALKFVATPDCEDGIVAFYGRLRKAKDVGFLESDLLLYNTGKSTTVTQGYMYTVRNTLGVLERIGSDRCIKLIEEALDQSLWVEFLRKTSDAKEEDTVLFDLGYLSRGIVSMAVERLVAADTELSRALLKKGWSGPQYAYANRILAGIRRGTHYEPTLRSYRPRKSKSASPAPE